MSALHSLSLLELDPDLGRFLSADRHKDARCSLTVQVHPLARGRLSDGAEQTDHGHVGLLLLQGVIAREVTLLDTVSTELLGPGTLIRPWSTRESTSFLSPSVRWTALMKCHVATLDHRLGAQLSHWPEINAALLDRLNQRAESLATTQAISQLTGVDRRVLWLFWHLAAHWGRVTSEGLAIPLTISHRIVGQLVGARRPTVSTALSALARRDELVRRRDGTWLLKGDPVQMATPRTEHRLPIRPKPLRGEARRAFATLPGAPVPYAAPDIQRSAA